MKTVSASAVALGVLIECGDRVLRHGAIQCRVHSLFGDLRKRAHRAHGRVLRAAAQAPNALPDPLVDRIDVTISAAMIAPWLACYPFGAFFSLTRNSVTQPLNGG